MYRIRYIEWATVQFGLKSFSSGPFAHPYWRCVYIGNCAFVVNLLNHACHLYIQNNHFWLEIRWVLSNSVLNLIKLKIHNRTRHNWWIKKCFSLSSNEKKQNKTKQNGSRAIIPKKTIEDESIDEAWLPVLGSTVMVGTWIIAGH